MGWGCDTHRYESLADMRCELPARLARSDARVLKQYRGHSGDGIWRVELASPAATVTGATLVCARHARRGAAEEIIPLDAFYGLCAPYFAALNGEGRMIDQVYQPRLPDGMVRCYLVHSRVEDFGHQAVVALHLNEAQTTPRYYHPSTMPEFERLKHMLETEWAPQAQRLLQIGSADLSALWECDFMFGPKNVAGEDSYVLCEINVSSVSPFPDSTVMPLARAVAARC